MAFHDWVIKEITAIRKELASQDSKSKYIKDLQEVLEYKAGMYVPVYDLALKKTIKFPFTNQKQNLAGYQLRSEIDIANGYVGLDANSKVREAFIPNLPISRISNLDKTLASKIHIDPNGDENKFFNEKGEAKEVIVFEPLKVYDNNGIKQFEGDSIQFDNNFIINNIERKVELKTKNLRTLSVKNSNPLAVNFKPSNINALKEATKNLGILFSSSTMHIMTFNFTFQPRASFGSGAIPNKILYEYILVPINGKFNTNEGAFETTLFKIIVEGSSNITDSLENFESNKIAFLTPTLNSGGNSFTKLSFKEKTYDYQGNVISSKNKTHYVQTLDFTELGYKGNKLIETLVFDLKIKATIEFEDPNNISGNNAICKTNTIFKALINEKI
ncbi:hypothetical protein TM902_140017 [Tenacibaculum maritimum]|uniref:hypothetical protein n=1 Tax=Tenacibaculum maritimum TaxID=107401 RepID=UPI0012E419A7|nr:hypothetical protein [Tenacibaculum maritimum]CAA0144137.1 hypothetical protein TM902_140017 [Tenacibaculum maritimum]